MEIQYLNETVQNRRELRLSKLKNKRTQLENLLRSRQRLDYEIKNLQKSLARDQKQFLKEVTLWRTKDSQKILTESTLLEDGEETEDEVLQTEVFEHFSAYSDVLDEVLKLLLKFPDPSEEH